ESLLVDTVELSKFSSLDELDLATISLPTSISNETTADDINLAFTLYTQSTLFPIRDSVPDTVVGSSVISASVGGIPDGTVLSDNVTVNLRIVVENATNHRCVYWDFTAADGRGNWSIVNCTTTVDPDTNDTVTCSCNHLTTLPAL
uniref:GAIN-B domain-containing protein n=1 Tax=Amphimedon queenslandica TaxID=400682 RepID=A0A1X7UC34_AMPQE